jgi:hypothetical protein
MIEVFKGHELDYGGLVRGDRDLHDPDRIHLFVFTERRSRVANNAETEAVFG